MDKRAAIAGTCLAMVMAGCSGGGGGNEADGQVLQPNAGETGSNPPGPFDPVADGQTDTETRPPASFDVIAANDAPDTGAPPVTPEDSGPQDARPIGDGEALDVGALAGLWDYSRERDEGRDVVLFDIAGDGRITEYDDQADEVGTGASCYRIASALLASRGDDRYDIQNTSTLPGSDSIDDVLITVEGDTITFRYIGSAFDPEFGQGMSGITESYPRASGVTVDGLVRCDDA